MGSCSSMGMDPMRHREPRQMASGHNKRSTTIQIWVPTDLIHMHLHLDISTVAMSDFSGTGGFSKTGKDPN